MKQLAGVRIVVAVAMVAVALPAAAASIETADEFAKRLLGRDPGKGATYACFDRVYDAGHLASHPKQNVRSMAVLAIYIVDPKGEDEPRYDLRIGVNFRKAARMAEVEGDCRALKPEDDPNGPVTAHCSVACDGGRIDVALKDNGSILVTIPDGARTLDESPDGPNVKVLHGGFGADDKLFRVDRADVRQCLELAADKDEKAALQRQH